MMRKKYTYIIMIGAILLALALSWSNALAGSNQWIFSSIFAPLGGIMLLAGIGLVIKERFDARCALEKSSPSGLAAKNDSGRGAVFFGVAMILLPILYLQSMSDGSGGGGEMLFVLGPVCAVVILVGFIMFIRGLKIREKSKK